MNEGEVDGSSSDGTDHESSRPEPSVSRVSSSTNRNGNAASSMSVISSPRRRTLEEAAHAHLVGNALVALGTEVVAAAAAAMPNFGSEAASSRLSHFLSDLGARNVNSATGAKSGSDGSNSASPLSLNMVSASKPGPKPRAADSPGSGSTTSTTTGVGTPGREKVFVCPICQRSFGYKHVLQNHERTHTGEKPFECRECHKRFTRDHHLKTHMRLHTGEKPYHCDHCDRQFVQVANLRRHLRVHTGERPYACQLCVSRFSDSNQLKAHMLIHKGEKPFECNKCLGRFRRRHHLMHHKCPKDEANIGKPRRGRRPKAYEGLTPAGILLHSRGSPPGSEALPSMGAVSSSTAVRAVPATSTYFPFPAGLGIPVLPGLPSPRDLRVITPPVAHPSIALELPVVSSATKTSRRKQRQTTRILTPHQRDAFLHDPTSMQDDPIDMSVSPSQGQIQTSYRMTRITSNQDVLDLSRSRSDDSEAEPIEEDAEEEEMDDVDDPDGPYDSDQFERDDEPRTSASTMSRLRKSLLPRSLVLPGVSSGLALASEKIVSGFQDIRLHKRHSLPLKRDGSNEAHGNGGHHSEPEEGSNTSNGNASQGLLRKQASSAC